MVPGTYLGRDADDSRVAYTVRVLPTVSQATATDVTQHCNAGPGHFSCRSLKTLQTVSILSMCSRRRSRDTQAKVNQRLLLGRSVGRIDLGITRPLFLYLSRVKGSQGAYP
jgi:hypothetical protein